MKTNLIIPKNIIVAVAAFGLIFTFITITFDFTPLGITPAAGKFLSYLAVLCSFVTVVVLIIDVFKNNLQTRYLWTLAFLLTGCFAGLYYLLKGDELVAQR